jgi:hypothetical protein
MALMNDRLSNNPIPPREIDPEISPELQEIIYRALERSPGNRFANCAIGVYARSHWRAMFCFIRLWPRFRW